MQLPMRNLAHYVDAHGNDLIFHHATGAFVFDRQGTKYLDLIMGYGPVILGHSHPAFNSEMCKHLSNGIHLPSYSTWHEDYLNQVFGNRFPDLAAGFFKTSSEAVTAALRIVAFSSGLKGVIRCGFTGWHDVQLADSPTWHEPLHSPLRANIRHSQGFRGIGALEPVFNWIDLNPDSLRKLIEDHQSVIGSLVIDAYQWSLASTEVFSTAIDICRQAGISVILDETKTSGRVGPTGLWDDLKTYFDFVVLGKAIANGAPMSLLVMRDEHIEAFQRSRVGGTHSKELTAVYAGMVTRQLMSSCDGYELVRSAGNRIVATFNASSSEAGLENVVWTEARFAGSMFDLCFGPDVITDMNLRRQLVVALTSRGILLLQGHPSFVCVSHGDINFDEFYESCLSALREWAIRCNVSTIG